jgi:hypothetical protein
MRAVKSIIFQCIRQSPIRGLHRTCALMSHLCRTRQPTIDEICITQDALCTHPSCAHYLRGVFSQYDLNGYLRPLPLRQVVQLLEDVNSVVRCFSFVPNALL